jgi:hypothetical protein
MRLAIMLGMSLGLCHGWIASEPNAGMSPVGPVLSVSLVTLSASAADFLADPHQ